MLFTVWTLNSTSSSFMQSSNYLTNNQHLTVNIKISSLEGDTVFLLLELTRLVRSAFFSPVIMWQAIFNICLNRFCIFLWSRKQFCEACLHVASPLPRQSRAKLFHFTAISASAGNGRSTQPCVRACCSSKSHAEQAAQGTAMCLKHMVMQATATQSLTWESMWRAALGTSMPDGLAGHSHVVTWETKGQEIPSSSWCWR